MQVAPAPATVPTTTPAAWDGGPTIGPVINEPQWASNPQPVDLDPQRWGAARLAHHGRGWLGDTIVDIHRGEWMGGVGSLPAVPSTDLRRDAAIMQQLEWAREGAVRRGIAVAVDVTRRGAELIVDAHGLRRAGSEQNLRFDGVPGSASGWREVVGEIGANRPAFDGSAPADGETRTIAIFTERGELVLQSARLGADLLQRRS